MAATVGQECSAGCGSSTRATSVGRVIGRRVVGSRVGSDVVDRRVLDRRVLDGRVVSGRRGLDLGRRLGVGGELGRQRRSAAAGRRGRAPGSAPAAVRRRGGRRSSVRDRASASRRRQARSPITSSGPSERLSVRVARTSQTATQIMAMPTTTRRPASTIVVEPVEPRRGGAPDTSALIMPGSALVGRTPDGRAAADDVADAARRRRAGTRPPAPQRRRQRAGVAAAAAQHDGRRRRIARCSAATSSGDSDAAGRCGSMPAHHSTSSTSMLPSPATARWSSSTAFTGARRPGQRRRQLARASASARRARARPASGSSQTRPSRRGSWKRSRLPSSRPHDPAVPAGVVVARRRTPGGRGRRATSSRSSRPVMPKCSPSVGPSVSTRAPCPAGRTASIVAPATASSTPAADDERVGALDGHAPTADERPRRAPRQLDLEDLRHGPSLGILGCRHVDPAGS